MNVLVLQGSLKPGFNSALADAVAAALPEGSAVRFDGLDQLPFYRETLDAAGADERVDAFRQAIAASDALVMITPEHNGMPTAVLKNALDIASRPKGASPLAGKVVAVASASPSPGGGSRATAALVGGLRASRALPLEPVLNIAAAHTRMADGRYDDGVLADVRELAERLLAELDAARSAA